VRSNPWRTKVVDFAILSVESVLHLASRWDAATCLGRAAHITLHRLRADDPGVSPSGAAAPRIAAGRRAPGSVTDNTRASVSSDHRRVERLQDRICRRPNGSRPRVALTVDPFPVPVLPRTAQRTAPR